MREIERGRNDALKQLQIKARECIQLALLASDKPGFCNPIFVCEAKKLRDRILAENEQGHPAGRE